LRLYPEEFFLMSTPTPSLSEQQAIVEYIEQETGRYSKFIAKLEESIDQLREYRTAVVSAAVTGKIDVRPSPLPLSLPGRGSALPPSPSEGEGSGMRVNPSQP
jgi:hypothetical protein